MIRFRKIIFLMAALLVASGFNTLPAQDNPVKWKFSSRHVEGKTYEIVMEASIGAGWHMYDIQDYKDSGPNGTAVVFSSITGAKLSGKLYMIDKPVRKMDETFGVEIGYFERQARLGQKITLTAAEAKIAGVVEWMVCNDENCLPPDEKEFEIAIKDTAPATAAPVETVAAGKAPDMADVPQDTVAAATADSVPEYFTATLTQPEITAPGQQESKGLWGKIIEAILWGLAALVTPCVFPMVPMTVSFFLKGSENKARGRFNASMYGLFIVALYTIPIVAFILISNLIGGQQMTADIFNVIATHWLPNVIFFLVFMIFAASFFGAFEITLPSWMVNRSDKNADKGGLWGVFFMALTLVLVSFSCTGVIVGSVVMQSMSGDIWEPVFTMLAFSITFALPFTLFALFPSLLQGLPKSGGWLNSVKVVLGFIEVALGFKFLSVADQTYHWGILDREIYLAIWIVVFSLLGAYLLGKLRFAHDSEVKHIGVPRLFLSIAVLSFVVYLVPGMFGAPLKGISGYLPPMTTQDFVLGGTTRTVDDVPPAKVKYGDFLHLPHGLDGYFDFGEGMAHAREVGKPVFLDFTGHGCVNCREMEASVWSDPEVLGILRNDFVIIALYGDDKKTLPQEDWVTTETGRVLKNLGKINSWFVRNHYGVNAQPAYLILDNDGKALLPVYSYDLDIAKYIEFLKKGLEAYNGSKK